MPTPCPRDPHGSHLSSSPQTSHDYCEDGVRHPVFLCASTAWAPPGAPSRGCSAGFGNGHRREHHPEAVLQASGTGTAVSTIQRLLCRLREWAPPGAPSRGCSAGFGNGHRWEHHPEAALQASGMSPSGLVHHGCCSHSPRSTLTVSDSSMLV